MTDAAAGQRLSLWVHTGFEPQWSLRVPQSHSTASRVPVECACCPWTLAASLSSYCRALHSWSSSRPGSSSWHPRRCLALADGATLYLGTNQGLLLRMKLRRAAQQPPPAAGLEDPAGDPADRGDCRLVWRSPTGSHISSLVACCAQHSSTGADPGQLPCCAAGCADQGQPRSGGQASAADSARPATAAGGRAVQDRRQPQGTAARSTQLQQPLADRGRTSPLHEPQLLPRAHRLLLGDRQGTVAYVEVPQQPSQGPVPQAGQAGSPPGSCTGSQNVILSVDDHGPTSSSSGSSGGKAGEGSSRVRPEDSSSVCAWQGHAGQAVLCTALASSEGEDHGGSSHPAGASADAAGQMCVWQMTSDGGELPPIASPSWRWLDGQQAWRITSSKHRSRWKQTDAWAAN